VCISNLVRESLASFDELIQMKSLGLESHIEKGIYIPLHPALADLLTSNLISNAIRHNVAPGRSGVEAPGFAAGGAGVAEAAGFGTGGPAPAGRRAGMDQGQPDPGGACRRQYRP